MDSIKEWAVMLCTVSVVSAFITFLIPDGNIKKSANIVVSLFLLSIVILPVFGKNLYDLEMPEIKIDSFPYEDDYLQDFNDFYVTNGELVVRQQIEDILADICSGNFSINVSFDVDKYGNIHLSEIHIFILSTDVGKVTIIKNKIGNLTGVVPEVTVENEITESDR